MKNELLLDVKEIERELERFIRQRFARAELNEASMHISAYDEDAREISMQEIADRMDAIGQSGIKPGATHYAQLTIDGPPRGSGAVDAVFDLATADWKFEAEAAGRKRGKEPSFYRQKRLTITQGTHRFVRGLQATRASQPSNEAA
ncbi:MAG: hypothetical protein ACK4SZ_15915 [Allosphingosinicella sp.]|uniref:hypothetical protein n=1 Tax=Allosphingosinicella sp. TaxID=2823234 RepID=UPI00393E0202